MSRKVTITDVAKYANVSVTTVSLALSGKGRISEATTKKITDAINELGYIPNKNAATLRSGSSQTIGIILKNISDPFYAEIIVGINQILAEKDYILFLTQSGDKHKNITQCIKSLDSQGVAGIIIGGDNSLNWTSIHNANQSKVPIVVVAQSSNLSRVNIVKSDNRLGAKLATEYLIDKGHRKIAYLGGYADSLTRAERLAGFGNVLSHYGLQFRREWILDNEILSDIEALDKFLRQNPTISAFLCHDTQTALLLYFCASQQGRTITKGGINSYFQQQAELICFGNEAEIGLTNNLISYLNNQATDIGRAAANMILNKPEQPQEVIISPKIVI